MLYDRVKNGSLLVQFHPYKDGATVNSPPSEAYHKDVVDLYCRLLECGRVVNSVHNFANWHVLVESFWNCVSKENFALHFKNAKEIYEFIERGNVINNVKHALELSFKSHSEALKAFMVEESRKSDTRTLNTKHDRSFIEKIIKDDLIRMPDACDCDK